MQSFMLAIESAELFVFHDAFCLARPRLDGTVGFYSSADAFTPFCQTVDRL
jgi:hypothetical protein